MEMCSQINKQKQVFVSLPCSSKYIIKLLFQKFPFSKRPERKHNIIICMHLFEITDSRATLVDVQNSNTSTTYNGELFTSGVFLSYSYD